MSDYTNREQVRDTFGPPILVTETAGGGTAESFHTRRKFSEPEKGIGIAMADFLTFGLAELYLFPHEVVVASWRSIVGQQLDVEYDRDGRVLRVHRDGDWVYYSPRDFISRPPLAEPEVSYTPGSATAAATTGTARFAPQPRRRGDD